MPGGQPSTTHPIAGPWLSPKVVTRNMCPKLLYDMAALAAEQGFRPHGQTQQPGIAHVVAHRLLGRQAKDMRPDHDDGERMGDDDAIARQFFEKPPDSPRSEEHTPELQSRLHLVCRLLL